MKYAKSVLIAAAFVVLAGCSPKNEDASLGGRPPEPRPPELTLSDKGQMPSLRDDRLPTPVGSHLLSRETDKGNTPCIQYVRTRYDDIGIRTYPDCVVSAWTELEVVAEREEVVLAKQIRISGIKVEDEKESIHFLLSKDLASLWRIQYLSKEDSIQKRNAEEQKEQERLAWALRVLKEKKKK